MAEPFKAKPGGLMVVLGPDGKPDPDFLAELECRAIDALVDPADGSGPTSDERWQLSRLITDGRTAKDAWSLVLLWRHVATGTLHQRAPHSSM